MALLAFTAGFAASGAAAAHWLERRPALGPKNDQGMPLSWDGYPLASSGTGFYLSAEGHFATAFHVAGFCQRVAVLRRDGVHLAVPAASDPARDLAVFVAPKPTQFAEIDLSGDPPVGTQFVIVRYPHLGGLDRRSTVNAARVPGSTAKEFVIRASEGLGGGNSGSPVVTLAGGVAGMAVAIASKDGTQVIATRAEILAGLLAENRLPFINHGGSKSRATNGTIAETYTFPVLCYHRPATE